MDRTSLASWDRNVFAVAETPVNISDVISAGHFRGELRAICGRLLAIVKRENTAREPGETELQTMSEQFRVDHDLISAEETETWLNARGLTLEDFRDFLVRRSMVADNSVDAAADPAGDYTNWPPELRHTLRVDLLFSGDFDRLATELAWRMAARLARPAIISEADLERERTRFYLRSGTSHTTLATWLGGLARGWPWFDEILRAETIFRQKCQDLLTVEARARTLRALAVPLTRFELELMELDSPDAAREAFQCVTIDREAMDEVAASACLPFRRLNLLYEDLPDDLQPKLLAATPGTTLEPLERAESFQLCRVLHRLEPDLSDGEVRDRVDRQIITRHFSELSACSVRWVLPPASLE